MPVGVYKRTKEHSENISKAKKGCKQPPQCGFKKGHHISNTGRTHFKKGSTVNAGRIRPDMRGENNPNWAGGVTDEDALARHTLEYKIWKLEVYKKDKGICRICKMRCNNKNIVAHHLKLFRDFPELRFVVDNGITLCRSCHVKLHKPRTYDYD